MTYMSIKGYALSNVGERYEIGESGKYERIMKSLEYYAENFHHVLVIVTIDYEGGE